MAEGRTEPAITANNYTQIKEMNAKTSTRVKSKMVAATALSIKAPGALKKQGSASKLATLPIPGLDLLILFTFTVFLKEKTLGK